MFRSKKFAAVAVLAIAALGLAAGCSQQPDESVAPSSAVSSAAAAVSSAASAASSAGSSSGVASDASSAAAPSSAAADAAIPAAVDKPLKVALVIRTTQGGWLEEYVKTVTSEVAKLGGTLQVFDSQNDLAQMASNVTTAVTSGADILLIDNGTAAALAAPIKAAVAKGLPVVSYDTDPIDGVASINQDDKALATDSIGALDKDFNGTANIVVLSVAGYAPLDHRLAAVNEYIKSHPGIKIVAQTGTVSSNAALDTEAQVKALLQAHPAKGDIDAIWTDWNDFSIGAANALKQMNRSDIKLYTVDLTEQNMPFFWDPVAHLTAVAASNPQTIAVSQVRLAYQKAAGEKVSDLTVEPVLVTKADLPAKAVPYSDLATLVPAWTKDETAWPAWISALEAKHQ